MAMPIRGKEGGVYVPVAPLHRPGRPRSREGVQGLGMLPTACHPLTARRPLRDVDCTMRRLMVLILAFSAEVGWLCRC